MTRASNVTPSKDFTIADKLDEARALIEKGWCKSAYARTADNRPCSAKSDYAVRWCAVGAIARIDDYGGLYGCVAKVVGIDNLSGWNDAHERTQAEVIDAFKRAAELARSQVTA